MPCMMKALDYYSSSISSLLLFLLFFCDLFAHSTTFHTPFTLPTRYSYGLRSCSTTSNGAINDFASTSSTNSFDPKIALALGAYSFDTYNDPKVSKTSVGLDNTAISFHSTDIIPKVSVGVLLCTLRHGRFRRTEEKEFTERLVSGKSIDPYVDIWLDESKTAVGSLRVMDSYTSSVKHDTNSPIWNETFTLYVQSPRSANLYLNISDKDLFSDDDYLGQGSFNIGDFLQELNKSSGGGRMEVSVPIYIEVGKDNWFSKRKKKRTGTVTLDVEYIPWEQPVSGMKKKDMITRLPKGASPGLADWGKLLQERLNEVGRESKCEVASGTLIESMNHKLHHVLSIENYDTDTQAALWVDFESKVMILSFRGTEQIKIRDILTDINLFQSHYFANAYKNKNRDHSDSKSDILCHTGFLTAFRSVRPSLLQVLYAIFLKDLDERPWGIHITGHSLGGALASMMNFELARLREGIYDDEAMETEDAVGAGDTTLMDILSRDEKMKDVGKDLMADPIFSETLRNANICTYTFGAPRVGNPQFSDLSDKIAPHHYRVINNRDIVPRVPRSTFANRLLEYKHAGLAVVMTNSSDSTEEEQMSLWVEGESKGISPIADVSPFQYKNTSENPLNKVEEALYPLIAKIDTESELTCGKQDFLMALLKLFEVVGLNKEDMQKIRDSYSMIRDLSSGMDPMFVQRELELLDSILDTRAVEHHLEPSYFSSIQNFFINEKRK